MVKGDLSLKFQMLFLCTLLFLAWVPACGSGSPAPTDAPAPTAATGTPVPEVATDMPAAEVATDTPAPPTAGLEVLEATFAHGVDEDGQPVDPDDTFAGDETVHFCLSLKGRPKEGIVNGQFYRGDKSLGEVEVDLADLNSDVVFSFGQNTYVHFWLTGDSDDPLRISEAYRTDVSYDGQLIGSYPFSVVPPPGAITTQIREASLALGADSDYNPVQPTDTFAPDQEVYLVMRGDIGLFTWLKAEWYVDGQLDETGTRNITVQENAPETGFFFSFMPEDGWPVGEHQVVLTVNDKETGRYDFTVETASAESESPDDAAGMVLFEDPNGVFNLRYPSDFDQVVAQEENYGYSFSTSDGDGFIGVLFIPDESPVSDDEWQTIVETVTGKGFLGLSADPMELDRKVGEPGIHAFYLEIESQEDDVHGLVWVEEAEGVVTALFLVVPIDEWPERQAEISASLESFVWSPEAVRDVTS
jgi:hypothetical protein